MAGVDDRVLVVVCCQNLKRVAGQNSREELCHWIRRHYHDAHVAGTRVSQFAVHSFLSGSVGLVSRRAGALKLPRVIDHLILDLVAIASVIGR